MIAKFFSRLIKRLLSRSKRSKRTQLVLRLTQTLEKDKTEGSFGIVANYLQYGEYWWRCVALPNWKED